jgi:rSAM/selenodomain-associated transferase 2
MGDHPTLTIILPVLNERELIGPALEHLGGLGAQELIVVDGGSTDGTLRQIERSGVTYLQTAPGRAGQMNAGAAAAGSQVLLFAHVDMRFEKGALSRIRAEISRSAVGGGFFKRYQPANRALRCYGWGLNQLLLRRMKWMVGTNGIFVTRALFQAMGGFEAVPILEDLRFSRRLKAQGPLRVIPSPVQVSARRYWRRGVLRQMALNGWVLLCHSLGIYRPEKLRKAYDSKAKAESFRPQSASYRGERS